MSFLREAALEARRLCRRIDVGVPLRQFIDSNAPIPTNAPLPPRGAYFIAFLGNDLVGSGALRPLDETTVEVRRMYVIRSARRAGVGGALLAHLERTAADLGFRAMRLETGVAFRSISRRGSTPASGWLHRLVRPLAQHSR